jgi:hypothetical protein
MVHQIVSLRVSQSPIHYEEVDLMKRFATGVTLATVLLVSSAVAADLTSGPQVGKSVGAFHPLNVTGRAAGQKNCLV